VILSARPSPSVSSRILRVLGGIGDPQPASLVERHVHGLQDVRFRGNQLNFESRGKSEAGPFPRGSERVGGTYVRLEGILSRRGSDRGQDHRPSQQESPQASKRRGGRHPQLERSRRGVHGDSAGGATAAKRGSDGESEREKQPGFSLHHRQEARGDQVCRFALARGVDLGARGKNRTSSTADQPARRRGRAARMPARVLFLADTPRGCYIVRS
jgi:hypothetical protein